MMASERKKKRTSAVTVIRKDDLDFKEMIGEGGFGSVYHSVLKSTSQDVAAKRLFEVDRNELEVLSSLNHQNIVRLIGVVDEEYNFMLILELCKGGSLRSNLNQNKQSKLTPSKFTSWATQAANAIEYLQGKKLIHKDIKSENYLVADNDVLKLADFGLSKHANKTRSNATERGTAAYMAPEIHTEHKLSPTLDIFAYAVVLWELLTRQTPFEGKESHWIIYHVCGLGVRLQIPQDCPKDLADLMRQCWEENRHKRPTIKEVLQVVSRPRQTLIDESIQQKEDETSKIEDLSLRNYQLELAEPALPGPNGAKNTIIVAPTGSGKTIVAVKVVKEFLQTGGSFLEAAISSADVENSHIKKVVFLVTEVALLEQQTKVFQRFFDTNAIIGLSGESTQGPLGLIFEEKSVLVMTAQILVNAVQNKEVELSQIGLLILDECHNCQKGTPYNKIMGIYRDMKLSSVEPRPQILGMTASLDIGQAKSHTQAEDNIWQLCANLDAEVLSTVHSKQCLEELAAYQHIPDEDIIEVQGQKEDPFADVINALMGDIEDFMQATEGWNTLLQGNPKLKVPISRGSQPYEQWTVQTEDGIAIMLTDKATQRKLMACTHHLKMYNDCLDINRNIRTKDALKHLEKFRLDLATQKDGFDDTDKFLVNLFDETKDHLKKIRDDPNNRNPVLEKLGAVLQKAFTTTADVTEKRGILFTKTRASTKALKTWVEETEELKFLKPGHLTGSGKSGGMTQHQQVDLLDKFRKGNHKLIIATSVAQEGLDIAQCNVVIRYNHISSVVGRIQTRGRNRAKGGLFYLVVDEQLKLKDRSMMNRIREKMMLKATEKVQQALIQNRARMLDRITQLQQKDQVDREIKIKNESLKHKQKVTARVKLLCRKCSELACYSDDIRCIKEAHHVVITDEFTNKFDTKEDPRLPRPVDDLEIQKKIICKKCKLDWGTMAVYIGMSIPLLSITNFVIEDSNGKKQRVKKWGNVLFKVESISAEDLQKYVN